MIRKILFTLLTALIAASLIGCGSDSSNDVKKVPDVKVEGSADKAVLGYAQLYAYGMIDEEARSAIGLSDADCEEIRLQVVTPLTEAFRQYPLSETNVVQLTGDYLEKLSRAMAITTKLKTADPKGPLVELTASVPDIEALDAVIEKNTDLVALGAAMGELQAQGMTIEQLKENPAFQKFALESIHRFLDEFPLKPETTIELRCEAVTGADGKLYWAPTDMEKLKKFIAIE